MGKERRCERRNEYTNKDEIDGMRGSRVAEREVKP